MYLKIRTKNYSAEPLRRSIKTNVPAVFRLGSTTPCEHIFGPKVDLNRVIQINKVEACRNSSNKIIMKKCFDVGEVKTSTWSEIQRISNGEAWDEFPAIIKHINSSKGNGIHYIENKEDLDSFINETQSLNRYIIEKYYTYSKEYRLHVAADGCFYACRKMLKRDAEIRWHRHDVNSVWILEDNELFERPSNWDSIVNECVKAMNSVGLDICSCDVKVQSEKNVDRNGSPEFIIMEVNSASSLGDVGIEKYKEKLIKILENV